MAEIKTRSVLEILQNRSEQIVIPIYQRNYDWKEENAIKLLEDILDFQNQYEEDNESIYFLGNMVYKPIGSLEDNITKLALVDGQQRITTVLLILYCLKEINPNLSLNNYLTVDDGKEEKLKISKLNNSSTLNKIFEGRRVDKNEENINYYKNYIAIKEWIKSKKVNTSVLRNLLAQTSVAWVKLSKKENENKIFEVINSTGKPLTSSDLIKNYIFFNAMNFSDEEEDELSNIYLNEIEMEFEDSNEIDNFYRYYVAVKGNYELPKIGSRDIYKYFVKLIKENNMEITNFYKTKELLLDILKSAKIYSKSENSNKNISNTDESKQYFFQNIFSSSKNTYYGIYFSIMDYWTSLSQDKDYDLIFKENSPAYKDILKTIARIVIYRSISAKKDKNITRDAIRFFNDYIKESEKINEKISLSGFVSFMEKRDSEEQRVPRDEDLLESVLNLDAYKISVKKTKNILLASELGSNTTTAFTMFDVKWQIEHIMPRSWEQYWLSDIGKENINHYAKNIHTLPNLTLLTENLNPSIGNREFSYKKEKIIEDSRLQIDKLMIDHEKYNDVFLKARANFIVDNIKKLFSLENL